MENPLTEKEVNHIYEALTAFRDEFCNIREGMTEDEKNSYICKDCPFHKHNGKCKLKIWVHKHGFNICGDDNE